MKATPHSLEIEAHPCFSRAAAGQFGRVHLPVASRCNIRCNFCNRKYDCANENRPGVSSSLLTPPTALVQLDRILANRPDIRVVGIAGPGDPFASPNETLATLRMIRKRHPHLLLCLATNGLAIEPYIDELTDLHVQHVTLTISAIDPEIGAQIYAWVRDGSKLLRSVQGATTLIARQLNALVQLKNRGITVKVNTIVVPGINDEHITEVAAKVGALGADLINYMPMVPVPGAAFESKEAPDDLMMARVRLQSERFLPQMRHCQHCRADAVGLIGEETTLDTANPPQIFTAVDALDESRPYVAVATQFGTNVDQHLGEASQLAVYGPDVVTPDAYQLIAMRTAPSGGRGEARWHELGDLLKDCRALLVAAAGPTPQRTLADSGVKVIEIEGAVGNCLNAIYHNRFEAVARPFHCDPGVTCQGTGQRCRS